MNHCTCPSWSPEATCQFCAYGAGPMACGCGRTLPLAVLREAARTDKGVRCESCGARMSADEALMRAMPLA